MVSSLSSMVDACHSLRRVRSSGVMLGPAEGSRFEQSIVDDVVVWFEEAKDLSEILGESPRD